MPDRCSVKDCGEEATIRQPLYLGSELVVHVPLCAAHSEVWEAFSKKLRGRQAQALREGRDAAWLLDAALAYGPGVPDPC
jgi:hypothetical protein